METNLEKLEAMKKKLGVTAPSLKTIIAKNKEKREAEKAAEHLQQPQQPA